MYRKCMIRPLFKKYQKELLKFCNTDNGRSFLLDNWGGKADGQIIKVTPDSFHEIKDSYEDKLIVQATFFPRSPYLKKFAEMLTYLDIMGGIKEYKTIPINKLWKYSYLATTFNPDANPESTSVDGYVNRNSVNETYATIRAGAGNGSDDTATNDRTCRIIATTTSNQYDTLQRSIYLFDTSALTALATISASVFSLYATVVVNAYSDSIRLTTSTPASNTALVNADYAQTGTTAQSTDVTMASITTSAYNDWTLNATGLSNISKTGITKFATRNTTDADNSAPTWSSGAESGISVNYSDTGSNKPKLVVTYTVPTGGFIGIL